MIPKTFQQSDQVSSRGSQGASSHVALTTKSSSKIRLQAVDTVKFCHFLPKSCTPIGVHRTLAPPPLVGLQQVSGLPRSADMVFDCRFLRNPYWEPSLRGMNGTQKEVADYVHADPLFESFAGQVNSLCQLILPACKTEGKSHISLAFGCTGGQHRSVTLAEHLAFKLSNDGWQVSIRHRELDRSKREETSR